MALMRRIDGGETAPGVAPLPSDGAARDLLLQVYRGELGVPERLLAGLTHFFEGRKYVKVAAGDYGAAGAMAVERAGIPVVRAQTRPPKPATAGAMALGGHAQGPFLDVTEEEAEAFFRRKPLFTGPERASAVAEGGHVLLRLHGYTLGIGMRRGEAVISLFPKAWSEAAFGGA
ncbi:MAG: hypothetical protein ACLFMS_05595 [Halorhodospira sp.]